MWCSKKTLVLKMSQYSQEITCVGVSFLKKFGHQACSFIRKKLQHKCFPVNVAKFLRTPFYRASVNGCLNVFLHEKITQQAT